MEEMKRSLSRIFECGTKWRKRHGYQGCAGEKPKSGAWRICVVMFRTCFLTSWSLCARVACASMHAAAKFCELQILTRAVANLET